MSALPQSLEKLISSFARFPGIGKKTAQRLGFYVLKSEDELAETFAKALVDVKQKVHFCDICHNISEYNTCEVCSDVRRDSSTICVVEEAPDIFIFDKTGYMGLYHVLGGVLAPLDGIGPDELNIRTLMNRLNGVAEIIVATNASIEGDTTALYLSRLIKPLGIKLTRLARGLPVGGHLEYIDEATLSRSIEERIEFD
jgi:recombination protein RecR